VPARHIVVGKWLAAWGLASLVAMLTLAGFALASTFYAQKKLSAMMAFGLPEWAQFVAFVIPFAAMTSALQMLISTYGRTYREAQTYVSYLATAVSFVPIVVLFSGLKDAFWQLTVPVLGQQVVLSRIVRGDALGPADWLLPSAVALALAAICVAGVVKLLGEERIVFGRT